MIYTRFGSEVELLENLGAGKVKVKRKSDGAIKEWYIGDLKADGGADEINKAYTNAREA